MGCTAPLQAYRSKLKNPSGKRSLVFKREHGFDHTVVEVPCGQCMGCRIVNKKAWALRALHEAHMHDSNSFVTLTYAPEFLPNDYGLQKDHHQRFLKRLRKSIDPVKIRYLMCGEYGEEYGRPHYHFLIFGYDFPDRVFWKEQNGNRLYRSPSLEKLWPFGHSSVGNVTAQSAMYVAGYVTKKVKGKELEQIDPETGLKPYELVDKETGEIYARQAEYAEMSRRPGLGRTFFEKYASQLLRDDAALLGDSDIRLPEYYQSLGEKWDAAKSAANKEARKARLRSHRRKYGNDSPQRKRDREDYLRLTHRARVGGAEL